MKDGEPELGVRWWTSDGQVIRRCGWWTCSRHDIPSTKRIVVVRGFMFGMKIDGKDGEYGKFKLAG